MINPPPACLSVQIAELFEDQLFASRTNFTHFNIADALWRWKILYAAEVRGLHVQLCVLLDMERNLVGRIKTA